MKLFILIDRYIIRYIKLLVHLLKFNVERSKFVPSVQNIFAYANKRRDELAPETFCKTQIHVWHAILTVIRPEKSIPYTLQGRRFGDDDDNDGTIRYFLQPSIGPLAGLGAVSMGAP